MYYALPANKLDLSVHHGEKPTHNSKPNLFCKGVFPPSRKLHQIEYSSNHRKPKNCPTKTNPSKANCQNLTAKSNTLCNKESVQSIGQQT